MRFQQLSAAVGILAFLISPAIATNFHSWETWESVPALRSVLVATLAFCIPVAFFRSNLRWYYFLLAPLIALTPIFLFFTITYGLPPGFEFIAFVLQTNTREAQEAIGPFLPYLIPLEIVALTMYFLLIYRLSLTRIPFKAAIAVSGGSFALLLTITCYVNRLTEKGIDQLKKSDFILAYDYPLCLLHGANEARVFLKKNHLKRLEDFVFHAVKNDTLQQREIYVMILGESSRYDRWQVNGYNRPTSPRLARRANLITYKDVVAGAHYTWVSVPQIITRATPDNYNLQYREKSILAAFAEAGFKTVWLSNQSDQDVFWSGTITLHAKTADVHVFSPTYSPNMEFDNVYDARLLPLLDSVIQADDKDLFVVIHTMGNHWDYSRRYPKEFDLFQPSGYTQSINPPHGKDREAILNSYDNSILYADHIIDSVIHMVNNSKGVSTVTYISDHGEDLFDSNPDAIDFHFRPSTATLKVPLFIWTSDTYMQLYPEKRNHLVLNVTKKIGAENIFYTLADLANIDMNDFDSTKSFANPHFLPSAQKFYGDDKHARLFSQLPQPHE